MRLRSSFAVLLILLASAGSVPAQEDTGRLRDQLRRVTLQLRQVQDDQAMMQAQKVAAEMERDALKKELAAARAELASSRRGGERVAVVEAQLSQTKNALSQATDDARREQAEREKLNETVAKARDVLEACQAKNAKLLKVGRDVLTAYQQFDIGDALFDNEPITRLARVDLENLAQDYSDRLDDGTFDIGDVRLPPSTAAEKPDTGPTPGH